MKKIIKTDLYSIIISTLNRLFALIFLLASLPLLIVIAFLIRIDSSGSIIFSQIRLGKKQKKFRFYKFRTMYVDAKKQFPHLYKYQYTDKEIKTIRFKLINDPRLTKFGSYLRKTSLDEIPNLINVIKGEMALIGPRPEIPEMLKYYKETQKLKFTVKPGITGYAQVNGRGLLTFQQTIEQDLKYIKEQNLLTDITVLIKTIIVVIKGFGAF